MLKRIIPFVVTFVIGLAVASFFVSIIPSFKTKCGEKRSYRSKQQLRYENERLRVENERLNAERDFTREVVPMRVEEIPNVEAPVPPIPPVAPKRIR
jgi:hypothetical protein